MNHTKDLSVAIKAIYEAGNVLRNNFLKHYKTYVKKDHSTYTPFDEEVEELMGGIIRKYDYNAAIMGEDITPDADISQGTFWLIDGIDGTTNYARGIPVCNTTITKVENKKAVIGVVYDFLHEELYHAVDKKGAYLNNKRIYASNRPFEESLVSFAPLLHTRSEHNEEEKSVRSVWAGMKSIAESSQKFQREFQSGALELSWLAAGRIDGYIASWTNPWDLSAGILLVKEAGGIVTNVNGEDWHPSYDGVIAGNKRIQPRLLEMIQNNFS